MSKVVKKTKKNNPTRSQSKKNTAVGFILNALYPGTGTIANNEIKKGVIQKTMFLVSIIAVILSASSLFLTFITGKPTLSNFSAFMLFILLTGVITLTLSYLWGVIDYLIKLKKANAKDKTLDKRLSIIGLIYNIYLPGVGTFIAGNNKTALKQFLVTLVATIVPLILIIPLAVIINPLLVISLLVLVLIVVNVATRIWAVLTSIKQIEKSPNKITPTNFDYITGFYLNVSIPGIGTIISNHKKLGITQYIIGVMASFFYGFFATITLYTLYIIVLLWATIFSVYKIVTKVNKKTKTIEKRWAVEGLFTNIMTPGIGTIIGGNTNKGLKTFVTFILSLVIGGILTTMSIYLLKNSTITFMFILLTAIIVVATWIFGIVTSAEQIQNSKKI